MPTREEVAVVKFAAEAIENSVPGDEVAPTATFPVLVIVKKVEVA